MTTDGFITDIPRLEEVLTKGFDPYPRVDTLIEKPSDYLNDMPYLGSAPDLGPDPEPDTDFDLVHEPDLDSSATDFMGIEFGDAPDMGPEPDPELYLDSDLTGVSEPELDVEVLDKLYGITEEGDIVSQDLLSGGVLGEARVECSLKSPPKSVYSKTSSSSSSDTLSLLKDYGVMRKFLSGDATSLELKHSGSGLLSWTTRGQISVDMGMKAITGLQTRDMALPEA